MYRNKCAIAAALAAALFSAPMLTSAQANAGPTEANNPNTWSQADTLRIVQQVRSKLLGLPNYGVFDALHFAIKGRTVVLEGYASRPVLKSDAENTVKRIEGVQTVENQIQVLPLSPNDDGIRSSVYRRIYSQPALQKYAGSRMGFGRFPSVARMAGGITQDPPTGYHAIHIIVNNGNVILMGAVNSEGDATMAGMQANMAPGAFSVDNDLVVAGKPAKSVK